MQINISDSLGIDAQLVMTGRCCVIGQSGSGKSYLLGVIAEELGKLGLPFIIIDTEGEYSEFKKSFDAIWVGSGAEADLPPEVDYGALFEGSIRGSVPIILDISEIQDKKAYVDEVLSALYNLEGKLKRPYLVIVEEADKLAPQATHSGTNRIEEISVRGRKRGIGLVVATQRPASISKNVLAQCSYGFIGKLTIQNDLSAVAALFEDSAALRGITRLRTGEFVPFGIEDGKSFMVRKRTAASKGDTPNLYAHKAGSPDLAELINRLRLSSGKRTEGKKGNGIKILSIKPNYGIDDARKRAEKLSSMWTIFRRNKKVESVERMYMPMLYSQVLLPGRKPSVFRELYVLTDAKNRMVTLDKKKFAVKHGVNPNFPVGYRENIVLSALREMGRGDLPKIASETGMKPGQLKRTISGLANSGMVVNSKGKYSIIECSRCALKSRLSFDEAVIDGSSVYMALEKKKALHYTKLLFPACDVTPISVVYLPFYKIVIRNGDKLRILAFDAIFMKDRSVTLLG